MAAPAAGPEDEITSQPRLRLGVADYLTLGNALCGFMAVWQLTAAQVGQVSSGVVGPLQREAVATAVILLLLAAACDVFDGRVARKLGGSGMGAELDNLADVISFGFAPAFFVVTWGGLGGDSRGLLAIGAGAAVLLAVVVRLARFSCQSPGTDYFTGLPSPFGAMAVVTIVLLQPPLYAGLAAILAVAWLMVSRISYPKPRGRLAYGVLTAILLGVGLLAAWALSLPLGDILLYAGAGLVLAMVVALPFYVLATRHHGEDDVVEDEDEAPLGMQGDDPDPATA
ncbi:CDP-alcohol phosphatidyltransferase family protein [Lipingzhangella sp. LS1_29]|uniref:CDP-alcohol phosphatidyltransferase family protein n=1 Tax=Lipingzhangella rawalii TaxID=2055835 RepID=A0ABU2H2L2_9ACTN|nr:CDP-alcohol phosphatidyltransferase family protein [Lipingzhangella rawalii]MDS1268864.1 CDP-alcohol phosphatidyltransferase family protein [Lipingzhangella rawalii]